MAPNSPLLKFRNAAFRAESALFDARTESLYALIASGDNRPKVEALRKRIIKAQEETDKIRCALDKLLDSQAE